MRCLSFLLAVFSVLSACQNSPASKAEGEAQVKETVKEETAPVPNSASNTDPNAAASESKPETSEGSKGIITGSNVTMRKEGSIQSDKLGSFDSNEAVVVLETKNVNNDREAILSKPITVKGSGGEVSLPKGKAVVIEEYQAERNYYLVTYQDPQKGKLTAEVNASAVETITYSTWYKVKRSNGEIGWVLGKFLKIN